MSVVRFSYLNRIKPGTLLDFCCEHPQFPATDVEVDSMDYVWQTRYGSGSGNGLFVVAAGCKYIDFDEGGAQLTATLTLGDYNGDTLAAEMKIQLDAAGALTYTVTYDEDTALFTIAATGNFTLRWLNGTHAATDISGLCGFNAAANDTGAATYASDYRRIHWPNAFQDRDLGVPCEVNFISILNHNLSSAAVITLYGADNPAFTSPTTDVIAWNASNIRAYLQAARTKKYFRLSIEDPTNPLGYVQVGTWRLAKYLEPNHDFLCEWEEGPLDESEVSASDSLNLYVKKKPKLYSWAVSFMGLDNATAQEIISMIDECGKDGAIDMCLDSAYPNSNSFLVRMPDPPRPKHTPAEGDRWEWACEFVEVV